MTLAALLVAVGVGVACALLGAWAGFRLGRAAKEEDDRVALIRDVAEKYHASQSDHIAWLLPSGICRLRTDDEIEQAISYMQELGDRDPLRHVRADLAGRNICDFFRILHEDKNPLISKDVEKAARDAKPK